MDRIDPTYGGCQSPRISNPRGCPAAAGKVSPRRGRWSWESGVGFAGRGLGGIQPMARPAASRIERRRVARFRVDTASGEDAIDEHREGFRVVEAGESDWPTRNGDSKGNLARTAAEAGLSLAKGLVVAALVQNLLSPSLHPERAALMQSSNPIEAIYATKYTRPLTPPEVRLPPLWAGMSVLSWFMTKIGLRKTTLTNSGSMDSEEWNGAYHPSQVWRERSVAPGRVLGAALLVAGGTVGAGIVALPVKTAAAGFLPSAAALTAGWALMYTTALIVIEVSSRCGRGANFTTMAERTLGPKWRDMCAVLYVIAYGATLAAYMSESAVYLTPWLTSLTGLQLPTQAVCALFALTMGATIQMGSEAVDISNALWLSVALGAYAVLVGMSGGVVNTTSLLYAKWGATVRTLPIIVVAFTFHNMIPSLFKYLGSVRAVRSAVLWGTLIPLVMYLTWEALILASLPSGAALASVSDILPLLAASSGSHVALALQVFSLAAIITSFLGVGLGCVDFLRDMMHQGSEGFKWGKTAPLLFTLVPPLLVAWACPSLFVAALEVSGVLRVVLFCLMPVLMALSGPFTKRLPIFKRLGLVGVALISLCVIAIEVLSKLAVL